MGWRPTVIDVAFRIYRCDACERGWSQDLTRIAAPRALLTRQAVLFGLRGVVIDRLSVARVADLLGVVWNTANDAILAAGLDLLIDDPTRFDGVRVLGVDEHVWRHRGFTHYMTVIVDLTAVHRQSGKARLLDMVPGRSKQVFQTWLAAQTEAFRTGIQIVAMDGFTGFKTAAVEELPDAIEVMDPFHVVALAGLALDQCRQRVQQETRGHRGRTGDPLYGIRRRLRTSWDYLSDKSKTRIEAVFADEAHAAVELTHHFYQRLISSYRAKDPEIGRWSMIDLIDTLTRPDIPTDLIEIARVGRTLRKRRADVLAYFDNQHTSNGPCEAINGRLEHLRGTALGFRNPLNYITRALLDQGGLHQQLHAHL
jgi:transposase